ncbi:MAG: energy transducer TonB [Bacteroidaceae bacterium]|nr:energy transducer TonB [Bacteroidaceae bacterium]
MRIPKVLLFILFPLFSSAFAVNLKSNENQQTTDDENAVKNVVTSPTSYEIRPRFPGGDKALFDFIKRNMHYPECAKEKRIEGRVIVSFCVETDGSLTNINIAKSVDSRLNEEALLIVKKMPKWEPGQIKGEIVRMKCFLPIEFRCEDSTNDSMMGQIIRN